MTDKLEIWNKVSRPPKEALKTIGAGRLKGMTDISPQWRYKIMTEVYGPIGKGWSYSIEKLWTEQGANGEIMAFAQVNLHLCDAHTSDAHIAIPGIGGSKLIAKEREGLHNSDEAYKMAVTDALSVAMKMLGVGADIYMGMWDGSKYKDTNDTAAAVVKADVKPLNTKGTLKADREEAIRRVYSGIVDCFEAKMPEKALEAYMAVSDADEKVFLQSIMDKEIKRQIVAAKKKFDETELATQA